MVISATTESPFLSMWVFKMETHDSGSGVHVFSSSYNLGFQVVLICVESSFDPFYPYSY